MRQFESASVMRLPPRYLYLRQVHVVFPKFKWFRFSPSNGVNSMVRVAFGFTMACSKYSIVEFDSPNWLGAFQTKTGPPSLASARVMARSDVNREMSTMVNGFLLKRVEEEIRSRPYHSSVGVAFGFYIHPWMLSMLSRSPIQDRRQ